MNQGTAIGLGIGVGGIIIAGGIVVATLIVRAKEEPVGTADPSSQPVHTVTMPTAPPKPPPTLLDQRTLPEAIAFLSSQAGQPAAGEHSAVTTQLVAWAFLRVQWSDVAVQNDETNYALAQKNIASERGKRVCVSGTIIQIQEETIQGTKTSEGLIESSAGNLFYFAGIGSSGTLVEQSWARFCGVVTDKFDYPNSAGGMGHAIDLVGMFDLPENRSHVIARPL